MYRRRRRRTPRGRSSGIGLAQQRIGHALGVHDGTALHHGAAVHHVQDVGVGFLDEFAGYRLAVQAGLDGGAGGPHAQGVEHEGIARLHAERAEGAVVVHHDHGLLGAAGSHAPGFLHLGVQFGGLLLCQRFLVEDAAQRQQVLPDGGDVGALAVLVVHVEMQRGRDLGKLLIMIGLDRRDQDQVGLERVHAFQVGCTMAPRSCTSGASLYLDRKCGT